MHTDIPEYAEYWALIDLYINRQIDCNKHNNWKSPKDIDGSKKWHLHHILPKILYPEYITLDLNLVYVTNKEHKHLHKLCAPIFEMPSCAGLLSEDGIDKRDEFFKWLWNSKDEAAVIIREKVKNSAKIRITEYNDWLWNSNESDAEIKRSELLEKFSIARRNYMKWLYTSNEPEAIRLRGEKHKRDAETMYKNNYWMRHSNDDRAKEIREIFRQNSIKNIHWLHTSMDTNAVEGRRKLREAAKVNITKYNKDPECIKMKSINHMLTSLHKKVINYNYSTDDEIYSLATWKVYKYFGDIKDINNVTPEEDERCKIEFLSAYHEKFD